MKAIPVHLRIGQNNARLSGYDMNLSDYEHNFVNMSLVRTDFGSTRIVKSVLKEVINLHTMQEITLPDGSWGVGCFECNNYVYPCPTMQTIKDGLGKK